jgi:hypothetical protein
VNVNIAVVGISIVLVLLIIESNINNVFGKGNISSPIQCGHDVRGIDARVVVLTNFCTIPSTVTIGNNFTINATLLNYSPNSIEIAPAGPFCDNPLTVSFDKNVKINPSAFMPACIPSGSVRVIQPGQYVPLSALPERGIASFTAASAGETTAILKLNYSILHGNSRLPDSVSGSFSFKIMS